MNDLDTLRALLTGLHFAQDTMRPHERETLHIAESLLARLDAIRELPADVNPNGLAWLSADDVAEILDGPTA